MKKNQKPRGIQEDAGKVKDSEGTTIGPGQQVPARWRRRITIILFLILLALTLIPQGMKELGRWLMVQDPLERAAAIVVIGGGIPFRAMEAASLYQAGWGPEIWVTRGIMRDEEKKMAELGISMVREETYNKAVLEKLGVPAGSIFLFPNLTQNTVEDVRQIARELGRKGVDRVILVTSKTHSRRVRATWQALIGKSPKAIVRYAREDPFNPDNWYLYTEDALAVVREVLGNINVWAGFPVKPKVR